MRPVKKNSENLSPLDLLKDFATTDQAAWRKAAERLLKGTAIETLVTETYEGINLQPIYHRPEVAAEPSDFLTKSRESWQVCQALPFADPGAFNQAACEALNRGQDVLYLRLPGRHVDGKPLGPQISTLTDLENCLDKIDLTQTPILVEGGEGNLQALAIFMAYCKRQGMNHSALQGAILLDPLAGLAASGGLYASHETTFRDLSALVAWSQENIPRLRTLGVDATLYHNAGATAVQELAFAIATGTEYLRQISTFEPEITVDDVADKMLFSFAIGPDFFMQIAKLRAARLLWNRIIFACDGSGEEMTLHTRTATWNKCVLDPHVNIPRATTEALAAIFGGCDSLRVGPFDAPLGAVSRLATRLARNTQIIMKEEVHLDRVADPSAGSWYLETLTDELAQKAWTLFQQIEQEGGMFQALCAGLPQRLVSDTVHEKIRRVNTRIDPLVGINKYAKCDEDISQLLSFSKEENQPRRSKSGKALPRPHGETFAKKLKEIENAFLNHGTIAQAAPWEADKDSVQIEPIRPWRASAPFETLRKATAAYELKNGTALTAALLCVGTPPDYKPQADLATDFLKTAGIRVVEKNVKSVGDFPDAAFFVFCGKQEDYRDTVPKQVRDLKKKKPDAVILLAGQPGELRETLKKAGADHFIFKGSNVVEIVSDVLTRIGVLHDPIA